MSRKLVSLKKPGLFSPSTVTTFTTPSGKVSSQGMAALSGSITTASFDIDTPGSALKSTQQVPLDWSKFERHTFFDSAESKVNVAFDQIINFFPFDADESVITDYLNDLTGYERYLLDKRWPKYKGYLHFSGTQKGEDPASGYSSKKGTYIDIVDQAGFLYPSISKRRDAAPVIDFTASPFTCAFHINIPPEENSCSVITQKLVNNHGFTISVSSSADTNTADIVFMISSGTMAISASAQFQKSNDNFQHCAAVLQRPANENPNLLIYRDGVVAATSSQSLNIGALDFTTANLLIGSGTDHYLGTYSTNFLSETTLSGTLDDFRIYNVEKNTAQIRHIASGTSNNESSLLAYYKFNEATGSYTNNNVILDSSGNSLHGKVTNFFSELRDKTAGGRSLPDDPVINERIERNPVLFPSEPTLLSLNSELLTSASIYDSNNPNLITRLVPRHYLEEEATSMGYPNAKAGLGQPYSSTLDMPGSGQPGSPQLIASLLFMWAKLFDEMKVYTDHFGRLLDLSYDDDQTVADIMLPFVAEYYGISLPNMFSDASAEQYLRGQNITVDPKNSQLSLAQIQSTIWRRILINIQDTIRSKGTINGIKSIMRATGINPNTMFRFRESGGPRELNITNSRVFREESSGLLSFSNSSLLVSPFLSGSRTEVGTPEPKGTMVQKSVYPPHGISDWTWDGLFTTGSWTVEFFVKPKKPSRKTELLTSMSLSRVCTTGSLGTLTVANLIGVGVVPNTEKTGSLTLFHRPSETQEPIRLLLTGTDVFDGSLWHISYGRKMLGAMTGSYFLRAGKQSDGALTTYRTKYMTASFGTDCYYSSGSTQANISGSFLQFGSGSFKTTAFGLNDSSVTSHAKVNTFSGSMSRIRFWTKDLTETEDKEHIRNFESVGVENPLLNFSFVNNKTGSFERLRIDAQCDQIVSESNVSGEISIFDYSQNMLSLTGSGFGTSKKVISPHVFRFSTLNSKFDERSATNKVRIAGFDRDENIELYKTLRSPVHSIPLGTPVEDDTRFSIEISNCKALNDDIILLLGSLEFFDNALGSPELLFAQDYPDISALRQVYFNRLTDKINYKNLVSFYKWINESIGFLIDRMVPSNTSYSGMNFVIESHMLERNKLRYLQEDIYLGENDRRGLQTDLNLQQVVGQMKRY